MCVALGTLLTGHNAVTKKYVRISDSYFWPEMINDITKHIQTCLQCQVRKTSKPKQIPMHPITSGGSTKSKSPYQPLWSS